MSEILQTTSGKSPESSGETLKAGNPPIGLILCTEKDEAVAHYALGADLLNIWLNNQWVQKKASIGFDIIISSIASFENSQVMCYFLPCNSFT